MTRSNVLQKRFARGFDRWDYLRSQSTIRLKVPRFVLRNLPVRSANGFTMAAATDAPIKPNRTSASAFVACCELAIFCVAAEENQHSGYLTLSGFALNFR